MSTSNFKLIAASVALSQVVTFGVVLAYKGATGTVFPGFGYTPAEINNVVSSGMKQREQDQAKEVAAALIANESLAPVTVPNDARVFGDLRARFTLAEFSDLECGFCKRLHPTLREIVEKSNGAVNWQFRHMPLSFHNPAASNGAHAAECYAEQKGNRGFWAFVSQWFEQSAMNGAGIKDINKFAVSLGADGDAFASCMDSGKYNDRIAEQAAMGEKVGATGTPATVVIDNLTGEKEFIAGAQNSQAFVGVMKRMLQESTDKEIKEQAEKAAQESPNQKAFEGEKIDKPAEPDALDTVLEQMPIPGADAQKPVFNEE
jgi:protein-disulfide isomerase